MVEMVREIEGGDAGDGEHRRPRPVVRPGGLKAPHRAEIDSPPASAILRLSRPAGRKPEDARRNCASVEADDRTDRRSQAGSDVAAPTRTAATAPARAASPPPTAYRRNARRIDRRRLSARASSCSKYHCCSASTSAGSRPWMMISAMIGARCSPIAQAASSDAADWGCGNMSGRHSCRGMPVARSALNTNSAGNGLLLRIQFEMFCWLVPMAAANLLWLPANGSAAKAL